jgi:hypothetical protein
MKKPVKFELGGAVWEQAKIELVPETGDATWWHSLEILGDKAMTAPGAHVWLRIVQPPGQRARRWLGLSLPAGSAALADWLKTAADLKLDGGETAPAPAEAPAYVAALPTQNYRANDLDFWCDYRVFPLLESLAVDANSAGFGWSYQFNAVATPLDPEELRAARKNLVRQQNKPGVPEKLVEQQRRILESAERCTWRCAEFLGAADRAGFSAVEQRLADDFETVYRRAGFSPLAWPSDASPDAADAWESGLHPLAFEPTRPAAAPAELVAREAVQSVWASRLGAAEAERGSSALRAGGAAPAVFLSYSSPDRAAALAVCAALEEKGLPCWIAPRDILPGKEWAEAIIQGINATRVTVVLLSPTANLSKHVLREMERSVHVGHPIVPVRLAEFRLSEAMEYFLSTHHWFDAHTPPFESHLRLLAEKILRILT